MCLPCFPWTWTEYEDPLDSMPEQHVWVHDGQAWSLQRYVSVSFTFRLTLPRLFLYCFLLKITLLRCASFLEQRACDGPPFSSISLMGLQLFPRGKEFEQLVGRNCGIYSTCGSNKRQTRSCLQLMKVNWPVTPAQLRLLSLSAHFLSAAQQTHLSSSSCLFSHFFSFNPSSLRLLCIP